jgi:hypothetical protein
MGKASSAKKVARAARAGGRTSSGQPRSFLFPGVLTLVVVLGVSLVVFARSERLSEDMGGVPQFGDHIHLAFGVNACGNFLGDLPEFETPVGIHTHGDGVLHVHPFSQLGIGANATFGRYLRDAREDGGLDAAVTESKINWLGEEYVEGDVDRCPDVENPQIRVAFWSSAADPDAEPQITTGAFNDLSLSEDGGAITVFYGDGDADIPKPPTAGDLAALGAVDGPTGTSVAPDADPGMNTTSTAPPANGGGDGEGDAEDDADSDGGRGGNGNGGGGGNRGSDEQDDASESP